MTLPLPPHVEVAALTKRFGSFTALDDVSIRFRPGCFHALLGENGAGKSTLVKCLMGYHRPDGGSVAVDGREIAIANPRTAHGLGLGMVYQHFTLVPSMTVAENLYVGRDLLPQVIDWKAARAEIGAFMARMPFRMPVDARAEDLSAGEKQKVEILKQLFHGRRFLILDEPTSVLTPQEAEDMLGLLAGMAKAKAISVLLITHKMREVLAFAEEVTVLRRGRQVAGGAVAHFDAAGLAESMVGTGAFDEMAKGGAGAAGETILDVRGLTADGDRGNQALAGVSLAVRAGEILGIAGVSGNGQRELVDVLCGQRQATGGVVAVDGEPYHARRGEMRRHRVGVLPEEPMRNGCVRNMTVAENLGLHQFDRPPIARGGIWIDRRVLKKRANALIARFNIRTQGPDAAVTSLSGGNVQRLVLARELDRAPRLLIAANPCFGLDVAAVAAIHGELIAARNRGAAILLLSEDLDELLALADRIVVMFEGRLVHETAAPAADVGAIGRRMAGEGADIARPAP